MRDIGYRIGIIPPTIHLVLGITMDIMSNVVSTVTNSDNSVTITYADGSFITKDIPTDIIIHTCTECGSVMTAPDMLTAINAVCCFDLSCCDNYSPTLFDI